jgi:hypothetical protein
MSASIPSVASVSAYQQTLLAQQVQVAALAKSNDVAKEQGAAVLALLESAVDLSAATAHAATRDAGLNLTA